MILSAISGLNTSKPVSTTATLMPFPIYPILFSTSEPMTCAPSLVCVGEYEYGMLELDISSVVHVASCSADVSGMVGMIPTCMMCIVSASMAYMVSTDMVCIVSIVMTHTVMKHTANSTRYALGFIF